MFNRILRSALPPPETIDWLFDIFAWLLAETGGYSSFRRLSRLVLPTDEFFPVSAKLTGHALAKALFEVTRGHAKMSEWPCVLVPHDEGPSVRDLVGNIPFDDSGSRGATSMLHRRFGAEPKITYSPSGLSDPMSFVATLAYDLSRLLVGTFRSQPTSGNEDLGLATEVCAVFIGFGIFRANSAFQFEQFTDGRMYGWRTHSLGYLDEISLSYALAIFLALHDLELGTAKSHLKTNPRIYVTHAFRHLAKERAGDLASLRSVSDGGVGHSVDNSYDQRQ